MKRFVLLTFALIAPGAMAAGVSVDNAWMRATAPGGAAAFEGETLWSGELGYGVRAAEAGQTAVDDTPETGSHEGPDSHEAGH